MVDFLNRKLRQKFMRHETRLKYYKSICARLFIDDFTKNAQLSKSIENGIFESNYDKLLQQKKIFIEARSNTKKGNFLWVTTKLRLLVKKISVYLINRSILTNRIDFFELVTNRDVLLWFRTQLWGCNLTSLRTANKIISTLVPIFNSSKKRVENCLKEQKLLAS